VKDAAASGYLLWCLLGLFCLRVVGQLLVVLYKPRWLPPMPEWYSGLVPYRILLPIQAAFIIVMGLAAHGLTSNQGVFAVPSPELGRVVIWSSCAYAATMVVRYAVRMARRPDQRWFGGTIPIIFHLVLAAFLYVFGSFHAR